MVWQGRKKGVFDTWQDCSAQVSGFSNAQYKSFLTREAAERAFVEGYRKHVHTISPGKGTMEETSSHTSGPILESICVDAACDGAPGRLEYRAVETRSGKLIFHQGPFDDGTNNVGEFLAIIHAAAYLNEQNSTWPIYSDSRTALAWIKKKRANTTLKKTERNEQLFVLIKQAEIWLMENEIKSELLKWNTAAWGEIPADFGRK